jgi:hypothetical protein
MEVPIEIESYVLSLIDELVPLRLTCKQWLKTIDVIRHTRLTPVVVIDNNVKKGGHIFIGDAYLGSSSNNAELSMLQKIIRLT